jgi:GT2 family glycosyltransferase/glycosyltransferase involved in cell wall biosynthesis/putative intracellular protease/amidase
MQAGHMFKEDHQFEAAEGHYTNARLLMPSDPDVFLQLGHFYKTTGRLYEAFAAYGQAAQLSPGWTEPEREAAEVQGRIRRVLQPSSDAGSPQRALPAPAARRGIAPSTAVIGPLTENEVLQSGLFNAQWYLRRYPDIARSGANPLRHFTGSGASEDRVPSPAFDPEWYRQTYPEVTGTGLDAFTHYVRIGKALGFAPVGPPLYTRWVAVFDTLCDLDRSEIKRHIADAELAGPTVVVAVGPDSRETVSRTLRSVLAQLLEAATTIVCVHPDCSDSVLLTVRAIAGADARVRIVSSAGTPDAAVAAGPVLLLDAGVELREHATYLFATFPSQHVALAYADSDQLAPDGNRIAPAFKPGPSPELMRQTNYGGPCIMLPPSTDVISLASRLAAGTTSVAEEARRVFASAEREAICHIPFICYHDLAAPRSLPGVAPVPPLADAALPSVTIIIPTRDRVDLLRSCIDSIYACTDYLADRLEVVVVDNGSEAQDTNDYLAEGTAAGRLRVIAAPITFNYSRLNNLAAATSTADLLVLLNNDTVIEDGGWLRRLAHYAMQADVAAVGPKLLYEDGTIQHAGIVLSIGGVAEHAHRGLEHDAPGAMGLAQTTHEVSGVTGACLAIRRSVYNEVGGLDENLPVAFNDVLLCLSCLDRGYRNLYVHDVWVRHAESKTRGVDDTEAKIEVFLREARYARGKFDTLFRNDPYYNPNLSLLTEAIYSPAFPPRVRPPWRGRAARSRPAAKLLLLSASLSEDNDIGTVVIMQARYLADDYDVTVGSPVVLPFLDLGGAAQVELKRPEDAAVWAVQHDCDAVIVHTWPYLRVARLLGEHPRTVLHDHGAAGLFLTPSKGERWAAKVDYALAVALFSAVLASSPAIATATGRADAVLCPPGSDRLGRWSMAVEPLRNEVRRARGWESRTILVAGGLPADRDAAASLMDALSELAGSLSTERSVVAVVVANTDWAVGRNILLLPNLTAGELAGIYAAADIYLDLSGPGVASLAAAEARALGAKVIPFEPSKQGSRDADGAAHLWTQLIDSAGGREQARTWARRSTGETWSDTLAVMETAIAAQIGRGPAQPVLLSDTLLSDTARIIQSGLFDEEFYIAQYPGDLEVVAEPLRHYMVHGWRQNRQPSALFHSDWYRATYGDPERQGSDPLTEYLTQTGSVRDPNPYFSTAHYLRTVPDAANAKMTPLVHYLRSRSPEAAPYKGPDFDPDFYARAYPEAASSGADLFLYFLRVGVRLGHLPTAPEAGAFVPFEALSETAAEPLVQWAMPRPGAVTDTWSAARFCIGLLCRSCELRRRFPQALSAGPVGPFAIWLAGDGGDEKGLTTAAKRHVEALFAEDIGAPLLQAYVTSSALRAAHPFALTPAGIGRYVRHLVSAAAKAEAGRIEQILWFAMARAENAQAEIVRTWQFSPPLQTRFPLGITRFGRDEFAAWLRGPCGLEGTWLDPSTWPEPVSWTDQIRLAWNTLSEWQDAHPKPFANEASARAFLDWLARRPSLLGDVRERLEQSSELARQLVVPGLNMLSHFGYPSGLRTSAEALIEGCRRLGHPTTTRDVWVHENEAEPLHAAHGDPEVHDITVLHVQPEPLFDTAYERATLAPRRRRTYRIGYWYWELEAVPPSWRRRSRELNEIWAATRFVADAFRKEFDIPVFEIMPGLELPPFEPLPRSYFGLPEKRFTFLFAFHMTSIMERKNPIGLIRAFRLAFSDNDQVGLVLKTSFGDRHPELLAELHRAAAGSRVTIIDSIYTNAELLGLMQSCDAYVSLHRSEGYGLTMAEAMLLGKPVIATNYSGNLDFMSTETSLLVDYDMVTLDRDYGPYACGTRWAEPSVGHAAECMRRVVADRAWSSRLGQRAREELFSLMSYKRSGELIRARLRDIAAKTLAS